MAETFMSRLREAIMPFHDEAEKSGPLHAIPDKRITLEAYRKTLLRLYGFVMPAEEMIQNRMESGEVPLGHTSISRRAPHLEKDLVFLGIPKRDLEEAPRCIDLQRLVDIPEILGCLYLFEGSRLGGLVLAKALKEKFGFERYIGYSYFGSDGLDVSELWKSFRGVVEDYVSGGGDGAKIISTATSYFEALNKWLGDA